MFAAPDQEMFPNFHHAGLRMFEVMWRLAWCLLWLRSVSERSFQAVREH